jgi:arylsulfatase A-like enzyme
MFWRRLLLLSASAGVTLTVLEFVLTGHMQGISLVVDGTVLRVFAFTIAAASALVFITGLAGALIAPWAALDRNQGAAAGILAGALPTALYLSGASFPWDHGIYEPWFAVGIPVGFIAGALIARGLSAREASIVNRIWPSVAPLLACVVVYQMAHQGSFVVAISPNMMAIALGVALAVTLLAVVRFTAIGYGFSLGLMAISFTAAAFTTVEPELDRPNDAVTVAPQDSPPIILLTVDTLRWDALSLYGASTPTPAIDALAADSVVFDRAYSTAPWTYVAFTSIHSGLTPWGHGVIYPDDRIPNHSSALAPMLRDYGYNTAVVGHNELLTRSAIGRLLPEAFSDVNFYPRYLRPTTRAQPFLSKGYPSWLGQTATTEQLGEYGSTWVRNHMDSPFLLWLHFFDPHYPYDFQEDFPPAFDPPENVRKYTGSALIRELHRGRRWPGMREWAHALYQSEVQAVDRAIGLFLATLKQEGIYDRAIIVFTSDHGEEFAEHNVYGHLRTLYNESVRVPLFVKLPLSTVKSRQPQPVSTVAIAPTIFDLAKIPYESSGFSGEPLRTVWEAPAAERTPPAFMTGAVTAEPAGAVVWENYKLIRWQNFEHEELYDQSVDPYEQYNLADRLPEQVAIGRALLADHAAKETERAAARGFKKAQKVPLTAEEERLLRSFGYLQ